MPDPAARPVEPVGARRCAICGGETFEGQGGYGDEWWPVMLHVDPDIVGHHVR